MSVFLSDAHEKFTLLEPHLNRLDRFTGDGDHGSVMVRGLAAAATCAQPEQAFRRAAPGSAGALFAVLVGAIDRVAAGEARLDDALRAAAKRIILMGKAQAGDKTMLDALLPAIGDSFPARAAQQGAEATRAMVAQIGRARYGEASGVGHLDPGAVTVAELLALLEARG